MDDADDNVPTPKKANPGWIKKGETRNPKGRPRARKRIEDPILAAAYTKMQIVVEGKKKRVPKYLVGFIQQLNESAKGSLKAFNAVMKMVREAEKYASQAAEETHPARYITDEDDRKTIAGACDRIRTARAK